MADEWAEAAMSFRRACYVALEAGMTVDELHDEIDEAAAEV